MASLTGQTIASTYDSLLKVSDNGPLTSTYKEIQDGLGNGSGIYVGTGGRFGIGTSSPSEKLSIVGGNISLGAGYKLQYSSTAYITPENNVSGAEIATGGVLTIKTGGTSERVRVDASGNVGIGTTSPNAYSGFTGLTLDNGTNGGVLSIRKNGITYLNIYSGTDLANIYTEGGSTNLILGTGGSERMRITSSGNVGIGTTNPSTYKLHVEGGQFNVKALSNGSTDNGICYTAERVSNGYAHYFVNSGNGVGSIYLNASSTSYNTSSDYRLKEDLKEINGLDKLSKLKVYDFKWKNSEERMDGVIAHELQEVMPYAVTGEKDGEQMQAVDYSKLVPVLVKAIQELNEKVNQLENK